MMKRVDHLGIAVEDLSISIAAWEAIGLELEGTETVPEQAVQVAMFPSGESRIELLQSTDPEGPIGKFIAKRGPGIHHVAFEVDDIEAALSRLQTAGVRLIDEEPRIGAGGAKIAFLHPSATGILVEICEHTGRDTSAASSGAGGPGA